MIPNHNRWALKKNIKSWEEPPLPPNHQTKINIFGFLCTKTSNLMSNSGQENIKCLTDSETINI